MNDATATPDLQAGISEADLADGAMVLGHVGDEAVLIARRGKELFAVGAVCTHYGGPLNEGIMVGDTVRCPWHHACFSLRTGEALAAPAFSPVSCWRVECRDGRIMVREKLSIARAARKSATADHMVIIGGGAAGYAAAEMFQREGHGGQITLVSADSEPPYDRPNLSKDYLAGAAPEDWIPLRARGAYAEAGIDLRLGTTATAIDTARRQVTLGQGDVLTYSKLLLATGAEPVRLSVPGSDQPQVHLLRSLNDCRALIAQAKAGKRAVVVGASFIGLEAAAALRKRDVTVSVVARGHRPMERVLGPAIGEFIQSLHEQHGVKFHLGRSVAEIEPRGMRLDDGSRIEADFVLVGIGVRPRLELAEKAGLTVDRGVLVDEFLQTSAPDVFAAGDIARWPDPYSKQRLRIEHWVVAERQGQVAARNMLGRHERYAAVPFFWTQHYDVSIDYVGHAAQWDRIEQDGDIEARDVALRFRKGDRTLAVVTIFRGQTSLAAELAMELGRSP